MMDSESFPESIPETLAVRREYILNGMKTSPLQGTIYTYKNFIRAKSIYSYGFWTVNGNWRTQRKPMHTLTEYVEPHTDNNPSSGSNRQPWSCEMAMSPTVPLFLSINFTKHINAIMLSYVSRRRPDYRIVTQRRSRAATQVKILSGTLEAHNNQETTSPKIEQKHYQMFGVILLTQTFTSKCAVHNKNSVYSMQYLNLLWLCLLSLLIWAWIW